MDLIDFDEPRISFGEALKQNVSHKNYNIIFLCCLFFIE